MRDDELEKLLQAGLESYGKAEPLSGLEERVLRRVQERHASNRWLWLRWATATACACLLVAVVVGHKSITPLPHKPVETVQHATAQGGQGSTEVASTATPDKPMPPVVHRREARTATAKQDKPNEAALPKLDVFPIPHSLTPEERAMLQFVTQDPKAAKEVLAQIRAGSPEQIQIAQIQIKPLEIGGTQQEETNAKDH